MLCIYCREREADAREHYLPQCLGRFQNFVPLLDRVCDDCNHEIGGITEREFCRRSPEAVARSIHWIKGQKRGSQKNRKPARIYQPEKIGGRHLYMYCPDPETGRDLLWRTDTQPGSVKEISQLVIFDVDDDDIDHIPIPTEIKTGRELVELLKARCLEFPIPKVQMIAASGDEERVGALFSEIGWNVPMQRRTGGQIRQQFFKGEVGPAYFQALAKIGFHYALRYIPTITGNEGAFRALRDFIRYGTGDPAQFLSSCDHVSGAAGPLGHVLTAIANPDGPIVINMQFFAGCKIALPQWRLVLGPNPTALYVEQASAHFFAYTQAEDGRLTGGEIVTMSVAAQ